MVEMEEIKDKNRNIRKSPLIEGRVNEAYDEINEASTPIPPGKSDHRNESSSSGEAKITLEIGSDEETQSTSSIIASQIGSSRIKRIAMNVESAEKSYGRLNVLKGLNMNVQEGYGLLGSSGCGKTTILSCIVGLRKLDAGRITIFGKCPGDSDCGVPGKLVGYMPQEVALNEEFTLSEVGFYFGRLYGMKKDVVEERLEYLIELLDLKKYNGQLRNLSGGQKRRASFLISLLHEPEILILDEPTVGVDPILRSKIWEHIKDLTETFGTTVVLTTHYIEEMRQAHRIGIMRGGQLMAEASPSSLLEYHNASMLEDVVLHYCLRLNEVEEKEVKKGAVTIRRGTRSFETINFQNSSSISYNNSSFGTEQPLQDIFLASSQMKNLPPPYEPNHPLKTKQLDRIRALVQKNLVVLLRNIGFLLFLFVVPALIVAFFGFAIGHEPDSLSLGYINEEGECPDTITSKCTPEHLSCLYLEKLKSFDVFDLINYKNIDDGLDGVHDKSVWGYIHFGKDFSEHVFDRTLGKKFTNHTLHGSKISIRLDMSSISTGLVIKKLIYEAYRIFSTELLLNCDINIEGKDLPVQFDEPIYGADDSKFTVFVLPGIVIGFLPFLSCVSCAISYIIEKKDGMLDRTKVAGVTAFDIMLSHAIPQFFIVMGQTLIAFAIMYLFNIPMDIGSPFLGYILTILSTATGMTLGFMAAELFDEEKNAMLFAIAFIFPSFLLSGLLWPLESLPQVFRIVSNFLPATLPAESLRSILFRGWNISHFTVYIGFLSQFAFVIAFSSLTFLFHKLRK